jgi:sirohydrochlorin cobaltochelatase
MNGGTFSDAALVVLGHGTALNAGSALPVRQHAAELRRRQVFASVHEAFWKQEPQLQTVLAALSAPRVFIVPLFISEGYFSAEIIPQELGLDAQGVRRRPGQTWHYRQPVGTHEGMTAVILARAEEVVRKHPFPRAPQPRDLTLFIAGHGTARNAQSRQAIERQAELIRAQHLYAAVHDIFMEESPRIGECYALARTRNLVVVPFFISDGLHVVEDIPVLLGEPERVVKERLAAGQPAWQNPTELQGKRVWYSAAVGTEPRLAEVILERVREAASERLNL